MTVRYVAIGDSFTEGVGDVVGQQPRGWADLVAQGWATALGTPIEYANLAIRGRLIAEIVEEQLEAALALRPTHLSFNGGGNDMIRSRPDLAEIVELYQHVVRRCRDEGVQSIITTSAAAPTNFPFRRVFMERGDHLLTTVRAALGDPSPATLAISWTDPVMVEPRFWSIDRLHLNTRGHHRIAARVLDALGLDHEPTWWDLPGMMPAHPSNWGYYRSIIGPWIGRRVMGRSSGDGVVAKADSWTVVSPQ